jgi:hypothetical protein
MRLYINQKAFARLCWPLRASCGRLHSEASGDASQTRTWRVRSRWVGICRLTARVRARRLLRTDGHGPKLVPSLERRAGFGACASAEGARPRTGESQALVTLDDAPESEWKQMALLRFRGQRVGAQTGSAGKGRRESVQDCLWREVSTAP